MSKRELRKVMLLSALSPYLFLRLESFRHSSPLALLHLGSASCSRIQNLRICKERTPPRCCNLVTAGWPCWCLQLSCLIFPSCRIDMPTLDRFLFSPICSSMI